MSVYCIAIYLLSDLVSFGSLLREISSVTPRKNCREHRPLGVFQYWAEELKRTYSFLPAEIEKIVLRLLFPEEDSYRRYNMKESSLARDLAHVFPSASGCLSNWSNVTSSGCLGLELQTVLEETWNVGLLRFPKGSDLESLTGGRNQPN
jgi:hypothetical protein